MRVLRRWRGREVYTCFVVVAVQGRGCGHEAYTCFVVVAKQVSGQGMRV